MKTRLLKSLVVSRYGQLGSSPRSKLVCAEALTGIRDDKRLIQRLEPKEMDYGLTLFLLAPVYTQAYIQIIGP